MVGHIIRYSLWQYVQCIILHFFLNCCDEKIARIYVLQMRLALIVVAGIEFVIIIVMIIRARRQRRKQSKQRF